MKYRQETTAQRTEKAYSAWLKVDGDWKSGRLLDLDGNHMPFPCKVTKGERYVIEVDTEEAKDESTNPKGS